MLDLKQITIVGTGLLGGSLGLALRAHGYTGRIAGVGRRRETAERARQLGCIDQAVTLDQIGPAIHHADLVVLATPLTTFPDLFRAIAPHEHSGLIVTDVGSTKQWVWDQARQTLGNPRRFVGAHPMAGTEQHGPDAARADLFAGKPCIITPQPDTDATAVARVESLWRGLGMRVLTMTPEAHDRAVAAVSHLPHALAALLVLAAQGSNRLDVASSGFRDTTRVASGDPEVWTSIFTTNQTAVAEQIDEMIDGLELLRDLIVQGDAPMIRNLLRDAKSIRDRWVQEFEEGEG